MKSLLVLIVLAVSFPALAGGKKAAVKLLRQLKTVDGAGSGLDADTLRGMAPAELGGSGVVVKDANGKTVGAFLDTPSGLAPSRSDTRGYAVRTVNGVAIALPVGVNGFTQTGLIVDYLAAGCAGAAFVEQPDTAAPFLPHAQIAGTTAYYPTGPAAGLVPGSSEQPDDPDCQGFGTYIPSRGTCCYDGAFCPDGGCLAAPVGTFDVGTLGLVPPFHVEPR